jgi:hypothetical protein
LNLKIIVVEINLMQNPQHEQPALTAIIENDAGTTMQVNFPLDAADLDVIGEFFSSWAMERVASAIAGPPPPNEFKPNATVLPFTPDDKP